MRFAWRCVKHVKSNAITVAKDTRLLGMGSGQPNRVKSVEIALEKAGADVKVRGHLPPTKMIRSGVSCRQEVVFGAFTLRCDQRYVCF